MTRKSEVALICTGPLAHRGKAVCYTKETLNLLKDALNIPPFWGPKRSAPPLSVLTCVQACIPFRCWFLGKTRENMRSAETCGLGELAAQLNEGLLLVTEWNGFLGAQTGLLVGFGKISASITSIPKLKLILKRKFWFHFWMWKFFLFSKRYYQYFWLFRVCCDPFWEKKKSIVVGRYLKMQYFQLDRTGLRVT